MRLQFRDDVLTWDTVKCFAQVQVNDINSSSLIHQHYNPIMKDHWICQVRIACSEVRLTVTNSFCFPST